MALFDYHINLHCSQTKFEADREIEKFDYHMNLHYSQTQIQFSPSKHVPT